MFRRGKGGGRNASQMNDTRFCGIGGWRGRGQGGGERQGGGRGEGGAKMKETIISGERERKREKNG